MRPEFARRLFLLASPGEEGYGNVRPFRPGVARVRKTCEEGTAETLTFRCGRETAVSPGDALFPPGETAFETPLYLIRSVTVYPGHLEAEAGTVGGPDSPRGG